MPNTKKYHVSETDIQNWNGLIVEVARLKQIIEGGGVVPNPPDPPNPPSQEKFIHAFKYDSVYVGDETGAVPIDEIRVNSGGSTVKLIGPFTAIKVGDVIINATDPNTGGGGGDPGTPGRYLTGFSVKGVDIGFGNESIDKITCGADSIQGPFDGVSANGITITF